MNLRIAMQSTAFIGVPLIGLLISPAQARQSPAQGGSSAGTAKANDPEITDAMLPPPVRPPGRADVVRRALASHPVTSPYNIRVEQKNGKVILKGRVGTKEIHDIAVRIAMDSGFPVGDDLVIATAESYRSVVAQMQGPPGAGGQGSPGSSPPAVPGRPQAATNAFRPGTAPYVVSNPAIMGNNQIVYPPPLFGRYDDPFYGLEPPPISYAPWFGYMSRRRLQADALPAPGEAADSDPGANPPDANAAAAGPITDPSAAKFGPPPTGNTIELIIDPLGVGLLRGTVETEADKIAIGQKVVNELGVAKVLNNLQTRQLIDPNAGVPAPPGGADAPPPPPVPFVSPQDAAAPEPEASITIKPAAKSTKLQRIKRALERLDELADQTITVKERDGAATISGEVPSAYEAMLAFRAVQRVPGVASVIDQLRYPVPDDEHANPLLKQGKSEDIEAYLLDRIRLQVGELAHIDRVRMTGNRLSIVGVADPADRERALAALRTIPILRGFELEPALRGD